jgi:hypothetical protein
MNIDWKQTIQGYGDELDKSGGMMGDAWDAGAKLVGQGVDKVKSLVQQPINYIKDKGTDIYNSTPLGQTQTNFDNLGNIAKTVAPLGLAAMMGGGMGGGQQGQTTNNYYGNQGSKPSIFNQSKSGVGSLSSPTIKSGGIVDTVAVAVRNRAINNLIDKSVSSEESDTNAPEVAKKEVEITSKYPEMTKLLEDDQNKAYLQKLLKN